MTIRQGQYPLPGVKKYFLAGRVLLLGLVSVEPAQGDEQHADDEDGDHEDVNPILGQNLFLAHLILQLQSVGQHHHCFNKRHPLPCYRNNHRFVVIDNDDDDDVCVCVTPKINTCNDC